MKKAKKVLLMVLCAVLLVSATVAGTAAYLTSTRTVTNTFTVGKVTIELKENKMDPETGKLADVTEGNERELVDGVENIKIIPGRKIEKQPVILVSADSEECWLFVKVENGVAGKDVLGSGTFTPAEDWAAVNNNSGWYQYNQKAAASAKVQVFTSFKFNDLSNEKIEALNGGSIKVTAYAVQAEGVDQEAALTAALGMGDSVNP